MSTSVVRTPEIFNFEINLEFLRRSPRELLHNVDGNRVIKLLKAGEEKVLFSIQGKGRSLVIQFLNGRPSAMARTYVRQYITEWFDLGTDLEKFYHMAANDPLLGDLTKRFHGYRIIGQPDLFESLVWAVLGQQINLAFAYTLKQRFVSQFGERLFFGEQSYYLFPAPQLVAGLGDDQLLPLQFSRQKSLYTRTIAEAFASGEISKEKIAGLPIADAREVLMKIKGVGNWTANYALMKTFRYPEAFPLEDAGLHNAIKNLKQMKRKPTVDEVRRLFKKYRGWEAYATLYLWKSL